MMHLLFLGGAPDNGTDVEYYHILIKGVGGIQGH